MSFIFNPNDFNTSTATEDDIVVLRRNINTLQGEIDTVETDIVTNYFNKNNDTTLNNALSVTKDFTLSSNASYDFPINYPTVIYKTVADGEVAVAGDITSNDLRTLITTSTSKEIWVQPKLYVFSFLSMNRTTQIIIRKNPNLQGEVIFRGADNETFINFNTDNGTVFKDITFESGFLGSPNIDSLINYKGDGLLLDSCKFYSQEFGVVFTNTSSNYTIRNCQFYYTKASSMVASLPSNSTHRYIGIYSLNGKCFISGNQFYGFDGHNAHCLYFSGLSTEYNGELVINNNFTDEKVYRFATHETFGTSPRLRLEIRENIFNVRNSCFIWVAPDHRFFSSVLIKSNTMNMIDGGSKGLIGYFLTVNNQSINFLPSYQTALVAFVSSNTLNFTAYHPSFIAIGNGVFARGNAWESIIPVIDDTRQLKNLGVIGEEFDNLEIKDVFLENSLITETNNRTTADTQLQTNINTEVADRTNADTQLQTNINTEVADRTNADNNLTSLINTKQDIITLTPNQIVTSDNLGKVVTIGITDVNLQNVVNNLTFNSTIPSVLTLGTDQIDTFNFATGLGTKVVNIGTGNQPTTINLGGVHDTININGNLTTINTTNKEITDKLITLNKNNGAGTGHSTGFEIETGGIITGFIKTDATGSQHLIKAPDNNFTLSTGILTQNETVAYQSNITNLQNQITANDNDIATNSNNIATNTSDIATNSNNIATNTSNIATNTSNIANNTSNIANNTSNIQTNANAISLNTTNIDFNNTLINQNANNILTNTNNTNTNTNNIATNTNSITVINNTIAPITNSNGNIGIGKNPSFPLDVAGDINATDYYINGIALKLPFRKDFLNVDLTTSPQTLSIPSSGELRNYKIVISGLLPPAINNVSDADLYMTINGQNFDTRSFMDINGATRDRGVFTDRFIITRTAFATSNFIHCVVNVTHNYDFFHPTYEQRIMLSCESCVTVVDNSALFRFNSFGTRIMGNLGSGFGSQYSNINDFQFFVSGRDFNFPCNLFIQISSV